MVQIRRESVARQTRAFRRGIVSFLRFLLLSAVIPVLFLARFYWITEHPNTLSTTRLKRSKTAALSDNNRFEFLQGIDVTSFPLLGSDIVELDYCRDVVSAVLLNESTTFFDWATPLLNKTLSEIEVTAEYKPLIQQELILELLEQFSQTNGLCDYSYYRPTVYEDNGPLPIIEDNPSEETELARLAVIIVAFQDPPQLARLIDAIHMDQHVIIIHLERRASIEFRKEVEAFVSAYDNVYICQFGTIVYRTDSVSLVNLRIMRWLVEDLQLKFDYLVTLDASIFPLQDASDMATALYYSDRKVWLGALRHQGQVVEETPSYQKLQYKRLIVTAYDHPKVHKRLPKSTYSPSTIPVHIQRTMKGKSTSGNQAIFHYDVVQQLLESDKVMELFALSKYGCCCCLEEHNWLAALSLIGYRQEALQSTGSMFQVWGGAAGQCQSSMNNAVLSENPALCFRNELSLWMTTITTTSTGRSPQQQPYYFWGNETWNYLAMAKERGMFFARKFRSNETDSIRLQDRIQDELWEQLF